MFSPGDKVSFLLEARNGVVVSAVDADTVNVLIEEGFEIPVPVTELVKVEDEGIAAIKEIPVPPDTGRKDEVVRPVLRFSRKAREEETEEVDLHIGELVEDHSSLPPGRILAIQLGHFSARLEEAIATGRRRIIFIHGVGEGILKQELRRKLDAYDQVTYHDAPFRRYGFGATEVVIG